MPAAAGTIDRALYHVQQRSLALTLGLGSRLWHALLHPRAEKPPASELSALSRRYEALLERDLENVERGYYDSALLRQFPLFEYLARLPEGLVDLPRVLWRKYTGGHDRLPACAEQNRYPAYYLRTFHWQTDGWLSERSARLYDPGVEFLFLGTADVMRRMAIPPVVDAVGDRGSARLLDLGCGTGRYLKQLASALPALKYFALDLSPFYLRHAASALTDVRDLSMITDNAEALPLADGSLDVVTSVFLLHELPPRARRRVLDEAHRVLKPGGTLVLCDSAQLGDGGEIRSILHEFHAAYHEPYYKGYLRDDLERRAEEAGFEVTASESHFVSKVVSAVKRADS